VECKLTFFLASQAVKSKDLVFVKKIRDWDPGSGKNSFLIQGIKKHRIQIRNTEFINVCTGIKIVGGVC
jgi:hypothetical protein